MNDITPYVVTLNAGQTYQICQCGRCSSAPFAADNCPKAFSLHNRQKQLVWLCSCGRSAAMPYCDGSHNPRNEMSVWGALREMTQDLLGHFRK